MLMYNLVSNIQDGGRKLEVNNFPIVTDIDVLSRNGVTIKPHTTSLERQLTKRNWNKKQVLKQFRNSYETVLKLFCFSLISSCGQFYSAISTAVVRRQCSVWNILLYMYTRKTASLLSTHSVHLAIQDSRWLDWKGTVARQRITELEAGARFK